MTKTQVISRMADNTGMTKTAVANFIEHYVSLATSETRKTGEFVIPGIGKLVKSQRKARMGRNPATGEQIKIPAKTVVKMRLSKVCKDAICPPKK